MWVKCVNVCVKSRSCRISFRLHATHNLLLQLFSWKIHHPSLRSDTHCYIIKTNGKESEREEEGRRYDRKIPSKIRLMPFQNTRMHFCIETHPGETLTPARRRGWKKRKEMREESRSVYSWRKTFQKQSGFEHARRRDAAFEIYEHKKGVKNRQLVQRWRGSEREIRLDQKESQGKKEEWKSAGVEVIVNFAGWRLLESADGRNHPISITHYVSVYVWRREEPVTKRLQVSDAQIFHKESVKRTGHAYLTGRRGWDDGEMEGEDEDEVDQRRMDGWMERMQRETVYAEKDMQQNGSLFIGVRFLCSRTESHE